MRRPARFHLHPRGPRGAFTLIEILMTVVLLMGLIAISLPRISGSMDSARVKSTARKVVGMLRLARNYAVVSGRLTCVEFDLENDSYRFYVLDDNGAHLELEREYFDARNERAKYHLPTLGNELAYTQKMPPHVYVSAVYSSAPLSLKTKLPQALFMPDGSAEACTLAIEDQKGRNTISIEIYRSTGLAKVEKGMAPQLQPEPGKTLFYGPKKKPKAS